MNPEQGADASHTTKTPVKIRGSGSGRGRGSVKKAVQEDSASARGTKTPRARGSRARGTSTRGAGRGGRGHGRSGSATSLLSNDEEGKSETIITPKKRGRPRKVDATPTPHGRKGSIEEKVDGLKSPIVADEAAATDDAQSVATYESKNEDVDETEADVEMTEATASHRNDADEKVQTKQEVLTPVEPLTPRFPSVISTVPSKKFPQLTAPLLSNISAHKYASIFAQPVNERNVPGYSNVIYLPQDLRSKFILPRFLYSIF